jgi:hypothetical protein
MRNPLLFGQQYRRNADDNLRRLEREASIGDARDELKLLQHKVRTGVVTNEELVLAKYLGDPLADLLTDETWEYPFGFPDMALWGTNDDPNKDTWEGRQTRASWSWRGNNLKLPPSRATYTPVARALTSPNLDPRLMMTMAVDCAERLTLSEGGRGTALPASLEWRVIEEFREWLGKDISEPSLGFITKDMLDLLEVADTTTSWPLRALASVIDASMAHWSRRLQWSHVADVLEVSIRGMIRPTRSNSRDEIAWQQQRLINYLLDGVTSEAVKPKPPTDYNICDVCSEIVYSRRRKRHPHCGRDFY